MSRELLLRDLLGTRCPPDDADDDADDKIDDDDDDNRNGAGYDEHMFTPYCVVPPSQK